jgi:hypothetical protein
MGIDMLNCIKMDGICSKLKRELLTDLICLEKLYLKLVDIYADGTIAELDVETATHDELFECKNIIETKNPEFIISSPLQLLPNMSTKQLLLTVKHFKGAYLTIQYNMNYSNI